MSDASPVNDTDAPCGDCGWPTNRPGQPGEYYMVRDGTWSAAGMETAAERYLRLAAGTGRLLTPAQWCAYRDRDGGAFLCVGCLEARLGRELHAGDFTAHDINTPGWPQAKTPRLLARLARQPG